MTEKIKYPALTPITSDAQVRSAVNNIIGALAPLTGQHRDKENQALTWLDLINAGYNLKIGDDGHPVMPSPPVPEAPDMSTPPAVSQFTAAASFNYVTLSWEQPAYKNHGHVEVWRAEGFKTVGGGPNIPAVLGDAVFRLMSPSTVASDTVLPADVWRYWARNVSKAGVVGPWTSVDGLLVHVPESPGYIIDKISGEIRESDLYIDLGNKIDGSDKGVKSLQTLTDSSYTVKIDSGNAVSGFGIMTDAAGRSDFIIRSDRFAIAAPQQYDQTGKPVVTDSAFPFVVDVTDPLVPKTLIKNAYIDKAFIESLVTGTLVADKITGQTLVGTHIRGGDMSIGANFSVDTAGSATMQNAFLRGTMQSANFASGSAGWQVHNNGNAELNNAVVRGTIYATDGVFDGTVYADRIVGDVYSAKDYKCSYNGQQSGSITVFRVKVNQALRYVRVITIPRMSAFVGVTAVASGFAVHSTAAMRADVLFDGVVVKQLTFSVAAGGNGGGGNYPPNTFSAETAVEIGDLSVPYNTAPLITVNIYLISVNAPTGTAWVRSDASITTRVVMFKEGTALA